jgi:hypothetical protein
MRNEIPVACCHTVFTKEQRVEYKSIWGELTERRIGGAIEIEKGYEYHFQGDSETLKLVNEWVRMERKCCPFLTFTVRTSNDNEPILLQMTGNEEAKAFLRTEIKESIKKITEIND